MIIPLLAVVLVSAAIIQHYGLFQQGINVNQPIEVTGNTEQAIDCEAGKPCPGSEISILNDGTQEISVSIVDRAVPGIGVTYSGELELTKKTVVFGQSPWAILNDKVQVKYTVVGNEFSAEVTNPITGYELIYYKDNSDRFNSPAKAIRLSEISGNLPYVEDKNAEDYDYCLVEEHYKTCHGAKIWYVPSNAINSDGSLDWSQASNFYFETELIQYNSNGKIITYPENTLTIIPNYELNLLLTEGHYTVTTEVNPVA